MKAISCFLIVIFLNDAAASAQTELPVPLNIKALYEKGTRSMDGRPGKNYWQNKAAYDINVSFIPETRVLSGSEKIIYTNNSPDTLKEMVFKLYPNIYKKGSPGLMNIDPEDETEGVSISSFYVNGKLLAATTYRIDATNMTVKIPPLLPGTNADLDISWSYLLNKKSHIRTGEIEEGAFFIAYFFPRIAVYDDIDGWNRAPYLGTYEFYNDFCDFKVSYNIPREYIAWSTGDLMNANEVFEDKYLQRIKQAETGDAIINIIDSTEALTNSITKPSAHVWKFEAHNVTDVAFAVSDHYMWQSSSLVVDKSTGRRTRADAVFSKKHKDYFLVAADARNTVEAMSYVFPKWPFPYSHETVFDGLDQMEYPMMVNDNPLEDRHESIELTDHEIFHTMFPFYMGINETKYGWMDEGWATIGEWIISPLIDTSIVDEYGMSSYDRTAGKEADLPIITLTTQQSGAPFFLNSYPKPAMGYLYVKDMLGDELFYKGLHNYFRNWNGKHPMPYDFFNSMNAGSGVNLNWFWKKWFFDNGYPDLAIKSFTSKGKEKQVIVFSKGSKPVPVDLTILYADGTSEKIHKSVAVWKNNNSIAIKFSGTIAVKKITLGSTYVPDVNRADNVLNVK